MQDVASKFNIKLEANKSYIRRAPRNQTRISGPLATALPFILLAAMLIHIVFQNRPGIRGVLTGSIVAGAGILIGAQIIFIICLFLFGLFIGLMGLHNLLYSIGSGGSGYGGHGGGGGFGGGGWSGGGGGFSGGGSSGNW